MKSSPALVLLVLLLAGGTVGVMLNTQQGTTPAPAPALEIDRAVSEAAPLPSPPTLAEPSLPMPLLPGIAPTPVPPGSSVPGEPDDLRKQIAQLEGLVEYLQGQNSALQQENSGLLQKLGTLGMKGMPKSDGLPPALQAPMDDGIPPDFVGMGMDLMKFRKIQALPVPTTGTSQAEVERVILEWLRKQQPDDEAPRFALALTALGWIDKPVDPLPLRAALLVRQLGGWYDRETNTLLVSEDKPAVGKPAPDRPLAIAYGQLLREYGTTLFPEVERKRPLTTDERLAREAVLAGDAGLTRFLFSVDHPAALPDNDLPVEDPDHPLNEVPIPIYLKELSLFPASRGFDFVQALHSAGEFPQINAAYSRPPVTCAEVVDPERYLDPARLPPAPVEFANIKLGGNDPYWDDRLGKHACFAALRTYNSDEVAGMGTRGWKGDRLLAYAAPEAKRDHAAWQTLWLTPENANAFFKAMRNCLIQRYDAKPLTDTPEELTLKTQERDVRLLKNHAGNGVLLIDAATPAFAELLKGL